MLESLSFKGRHHQRNVFAKNVDFQPRSFPGTNGSLDSHFRPFVSRCPRKQARLLGCPGEDGNGEEFPFSRAGRYLGKDLSGEKANNIVFVKYCGWKRKAHRGNLNRSQGKGRAWWSVTKTAHAQSLLATEARPANSPSKLWSHIK